MKLVSFDIFDTCLLRKCGTPMNMYDVLSYKVFACEVAENVRKDFAVARKKAEDKAWKENPRLRLEDIYAELKFEHVALLPKEELVEVEMEMERTMLVPSLKVKERVDKEREKGNRIIFISDMYLPHDFIQGILAEYGFYKEGDDLYVSNEYGLTKQSGELFVKVREIENGSFRDWRHYGDNPEGDVRIPKSLGISAAQILHEYTPYPSSWRRSCVSLYNYPSILAGVSHAAYHSTENDSHKAFVLDLIAPFYCSLIYNILDDARKRGISRLYFCARDTYQLFGVAKHFEALFPEIKLEYLYISRESLYNGDVNAKYLYFQTVGLATNTDSVAIVDITTSGKTIWELNKYLASKGCKEVFGYFFLLWDDPREIPVDKDFCRFELEEARIKGGIVFSGFLRNIYVFENFFALNNQARTVDYKENNGFAEPVFDATITDIETVHSNVDFWSKRHKELLGKYVDMFVECELFRHSAEILNQVCLSTFCSFFSVPEREYLLALTEYNVFSPTLKAHIPYVRKSGLLHVVLKRGLDSCWSRGSIICSTPSCLRRLLRRFYQNLIIKFW